MVRQTVAEVEEKKSFVVIGFSLDDGTGAIELLGEDKTHHLVGEGHTGETDALGGTLIDGWGEAVGSADAEDKTADGMLLPGKPVGKRHGTELHATLVEKDEMVIGVQLPQYLLSLLLLLLLGSERLGVLQLGDYSDGERHVMPYPADIVGYTCLKMLVCGLAHEYQFCLHGGKGTKKK